MRVVPDGDYTDPGAGDFERRCAAYAMLNIAELYCKGGPV